LHCLEVLCGALWRFVICGCSHGRSQHSRGVMPFFYCLCDENLGELCLDG
jgi:hypothetical protein